MLVSFSLVSVWGFCIFLSLSLFFLPSLLSTIVLLRCRQWLPHNMNTQLVYLVLGSSFLNFPTHSTLHFFCSFWLPCELNSCLTEFFQLSLFPVVGILNPPEDWTRQQHPEAFLKHQLSDADCVKCEADLIDACVTHWWHRLSWLIWQARLVSPLSGSYWYVGNTPEAVYVVKEDALPWGKEQAFGQRCRDWWQTQTWQHWTESAFISGVFNAFPGL